MMGALAYEEFYTIDDYRQWQGDWELIDGVAYAMAPSPTVTHQSVSTKIATELSKKMSSCEECLVLNETDYEVSDNTVTRPDVLLICKKINEKIDKTPEMIFEVLSPSTARRDETVKFDIYEREGVKYYIIVHPDNRVAKVYKLYEDGRFVKQGDFENDNFTFSLNKCQIDFDFSSIWRN